MIASKIRVDLHGESKLDAETFSDQKGRVTEIRIVIGGATFMSDGLSDMRAFGRWLLAVTDSNAKDKR